MQSLLTISSDALPLSTHVVSFVGREAISEPYVLEVGLEINDEAFSPDAALQARARLDVQLGPEAEPYFFQGVMVAIELLHHHLGKALYRATIVPKLWHLGQTLHSRIFTDDTIPEIIEAVLRSGGIERYRLQLLHTYPKREHVCQYKESDLDFISRWMEREGIYYFFEQTEEGEQLVITDSISFHAERTSGTVRYVPLSGDDHMALAALNTFGAIHSALPALTKLTDYDYLHPKLALEGSHDIDERGQGELQLFGENLPNTAEGSRYAKVRAEQQLARQRVFHGHGRVFHLRPNYRFTLEEHPTPAYNGKSYLVTALEHVGNQSATAELVKKLLHLEDVAADEYTVRLSAIPAEVQMRAARRHRWPRVDGYELARVDGEAASEYAQIDEHGRYKCRLMFDESDLVDGSATTWVRMMQPHGGGVEGFHFPLRKGTEVLVFYLAGDPDRPVIAGVVNNPLTASPVTSANHTKNVLQTGGRNRWELEDLAGQQRITLSTPYSSTLIRMGHPAEGHELVAETLDNTLWSSGKSYDLEVGHAGGGSWTALVKDDWTTHVECGKHELWVDAGPSTTTVEGDTKLEVKSGKLSILVDANAMESTVQSDWTTTVKGGNSKLATQAGRTDVETSGDIKVQSASGEIKLDAQSGKVVIHGASGIDIDAQGDISLTTTTKYKQKTGNDWFKLDMGAKVGITLGATSETFVGVKNSNTIGVTIDTFYGIKIAAEASLELKWVGGLNLRATPILKQDTPIQLNSGVLKVDQFAAAGLHRFGAFCYLGAGLIMIGP